MHGDQFGAIRKRALDLQHRQQVGDPWHHVIGVEDRRAETDQLGDAATLTRAFEDFVGDQC